MSDGRRVPIKDVKVGDEVILPPYHQGQEVKIANKKYILIRESEILMVIR